MNFKELKFPALVFLSGLALISYTFLGFQKTAHQGSLEGSEVQLQEKEVILKAENVDFYQQVEERLKQIQSENQKIQKEILVARKKALDFKVSLNQEGQSVRATNLEKTQNPLLNEARVASVDELPQILNKASSQFVSALECLTQKCSSQALSRTQIEQSFEALEYISEIHTLSEKQFAFDKLKDLVELDGSYAKAAIGLVSSVENPSLIMDFFDIKGLGQEEEVFLYKSAITHRSDSVRRLAQSRASQALTHGDFGKAFLMVRNLDSFAELSQDSKAIQSVCRFKTNDDQDNMKFELLRTRLIAKYSAMESRPDFSDFCD